MPMYNTSQTRPENDHRKPCTLCGKLCDIRVRCQIDESQTWHLICTGKCWKDVSGGVVDGDKAPEHRYYRYGGMWKNKYEMVSAKKKPRKKSRESRVDEEEVEGLVEVLGVEGEGGEGAELKVGEGEGKGKGKGKGRDGVEGLGEWKGSGVKYTRNEEVMFDGELWICRKSHVSEEMKSPVEGKNLWREAVAPNLKEED